MILAAAILLFGIYSTGLSVQDNPVQAQSTAQAAPNSASSNQSNTEQGQNSTPQANAPSKSGSAANQESAPSAPASAARKRGRKKKAAIAPCDASNSGGQAGSSSASNETSTQPSGTSATPPAKDCPPPKVVVRQGGTVEPSIQLAGGDPASQKRVAANEMLGSTEANLKKIAGLQLTDVQKDTVAQIRQFVDQSKAALAAGDAERGKTLAWKAQLLSEDLVQPQK
jgi:hypothetical protein